MNQKLRLRILKKLAQTTQTTAPSTTAPPLGSPPPVPGPMTATLANGYNADSIAPLTKLADILNKALHYASDGKTNYQKIQNNASFDAKDNHGPITDIADVAKQAYSTFYNNGKSHTGKYEPRQIHIWVDTILGSTAYNNMATVKPGTPLANQITAITGGGTLKDGIRKQLQEIKDKNPITQ